VGLKLLPIDRVISDRKSEGVNHGARSKKKRRMSSNRKQVTLVRSRKKGVSPKK